MKHGNDAFDPARRRLLSGIAAGAAGAATLTACGNSGDGPAASAGIPTAGSTTMPTPSGSGLPAPKDTGIDHVVVVMMENRSFDHMFGWLPGADGKQAGLSFPNAAGQMKPTFRLSQDANYGFQGCTSSLVAMSDPNHSYDGGRVHYNDGKLDGWLLTDGTKSNGDDRFPIGYYTADDLPFYKGCAEQWTVCDHYFSGILSATYPNRMYMHTGQTDRNSNTSTSSTLPAIWDRLAAKGLKGTYYFNDLPLTALFGQRFIDISKPFSSFLTDAAAGMLPEVTYVDPRFGGENPGDPTSGSAPVGGVSNDDHPVADVRNGQAFLNQVYNALRSSPQWSKTLMVVVYDEWGGFYDHVPPPLAPVSDDERNVVKNDGRLGFRVPCILIGPRAKKGHVEKMQFDPNSILNFICWRFGLDGLGVRSATSNNLGHALDFSNLRADSPAIDVPTGPFGAACVFSPDRIGAKSLDQLSPALRTVVAHEADWTILKYMALRAGFPNIG